MKTTDKFFIGLLLFGAVWLLLAPSKPELKEIPLKDLVQEATQYDRYVSTDEVAKAIMSNDPSVILIDVRSPEAYKKYTLPGAINIPVDSILNDQYADYVNQDVYKTVFFSNGSSEANRAWLICASLGYKNNYVMKGGLNEWIRTIIRPEKPAEWSSAGDFDLFEFRKGASRFFGGANASGSAEPATPAPAPKPIAHKKKKQAAAGGCE